jgi:glucan phosphoethanolaminetransferase (alkaline phosphatase superfamily)
VRVVGALGFSFQFVALGLMFRRAPLDARGVIGFVESAVVWGLFLALATTRRRRIVLAVLAAFLVVAQTYVFRFFGRPLDLQVAEAARHQWSVVRPVVIGMLPQVGLVTLGVAAIELALLSVAARPKPWPLSIGAALAGLIGVPSTPDASALRGFGAFRHERPRETVSAVALPTLHPERAEMPDILFILSESVRAEDYTPETTTFSRQLVPRVELEQMRAVSSYTVLSLSAVLTGRSQEAERTAILRSPTLFDFAHAAGYHVSYYSGHSKEIFETKEVYAAVDRFVTLETIAGREIEDDSDYVVMPLDRMLVDRFIAEMPSLKGSAYVSVLHLAGTHAPYYVDDARAPFKPYDNIVAWSKMAELRNAYRNSILEQDFAITRAIRVFIERAGSRPWLVVFTSDHGEAFGEHGAIHHGQNLFDEQVHVPAWIAGSGDATRPLPEHAQRFLTHLDLLPTMLDAMGIWDNFSVRPHREAMGGRSLLRSSTKIDPVAFTNCTAMFRCPLDTWGVLGEDRKLVAQTWDSSWSCFALRGGERSVPPDDASCAALRATSRKLFATLPNGSPNQ